MGSYDDEFAEVVERLRGVRDSLEGTSSPEQVHRLRVLSAQLVDRGEDILLRHFPGHAEPRPVHQPQARDEEPETPEEPPAPPAPEGPVQSNVRTVALSVPE